MPRPRTDNCYYYVNIEEVEIKDQVLIFKTHKEV